MIGIFGLNPRTNEDVISNVFGKFGKIRRINVIYDTKVNLLYQLSFWFWTSFDRVASLSGFFCWNKQTRVSRGYAFIYYKHLRDAMDAKESCSGIELEGRRIRVDYSVTTRPHERTPGMYKGRKVERSPSPPSSGAPPPKSTNTTSGKNSRSKVPTEST